MDQAKPFLDETIVSAVHGNVALPDTANPVCIERHASGVVLKPLPETASSPEVPVLAGKVHFPLSTLRSPRGEPLRGSQAGRVMVSSSLKISVAPYVGEQNGNDDISPLYRSTKVTRVDLSAGRELVRSWGGGDGNEQPQQPLPANDDFSIHIHSDFYGESETMRLNDSTGGLNVTLTVEFHGQRPAIMISSVALVQTLRFTGGFGMGGF